MSREIKFRAWDSIPNKMHPYSVIKKIPLIDFELDHYSLMQYTGLKDKNGVEIFEGDIVKPFIDGSTKAQVIFMGASFKICTKNDKGDYLCWNYFQDEIEVIGNIHENPELIKQ